MNTVTAPYLPVIPENTRRWLVFLCKLLYVLLIFEGALRKWGLPEAHRVLFFIKDPVVYLMYFFGIGYILKRPPSPFLLRYGFFLLGVLIIVPFLQPEQPLPIFYYGLRNYILYFGVPFIYCAALREEDLRWFISFTLYLSGPVALLCFYQSVMPQADPINRGFGTTPDAIFTHMSVGGGFYRTSGLFTSIEGHLYFVATSMSFALVASTMVGTAFGIIKRWLLNASYLSIFLMLGVSGSRTCFMVFIFSCLVFVGAKFLFLTTNRRQRGFGLSFLMILVGVWSMMNWAPDQVTALWERTTHIAETNQYNLWGAEEILDRVGTDIGYVTWVFDTIPMWGLGLGTGGNAGWILGSSMTQEFQLSRTIVDLGPLVGLLYYAFRIIFIILLTREMIGSLRQTNNPLPLAFYPVFFVIFLWGPLCAQGSVHGYGWIFAGLLWNACRCTRVIPPPENARIIETSSSVSPPILQVAGH